MPSKQEDTSVVDNISSTPSTSRKFLSRFRSSHKSESSMAKDQPSGSHLESVPQAAGPVKDYEAAFEVLAVGMGFGGPNKKSVKKK